MQGPSTEVSDIYTQKSGQSTKDILTELFFIQHLYHVLYHFHMKKSSKD